MAFGNASRWKRFYQYPLHVYRTFRCTSDEHRFRFQFHLASFLPLLVVTIFATLEYLAMVEHGSHSRLHSSDTRTQEAGVPDAAPHPKSDSSGGAHGGKAVNIPLRIALFFGFAAITVALESCFNTLREFSDWIELREMEISRRTAVGATDPLAPDVEKWYRDDLLQKKAGLMKKKVRTVGCIVLWLIAGYCESRHVLAMETSFWQNFTVGLCVSIVLVMALVKLWWLSGDEFTAKNAVTLVNRIPQSNRIPPPGNQPVMASTGP